VTSARAIPAVFRQTFLNPKSGTNDQKQQGILNEGAPAKYA
jgi:hypothetical protein